MNVLNNTNGNSSRTNEKNIPALAFIALTVGLCVFPLLATLFGSGGTSERMESAASLPSISDSDGFNENYLSELGGYYSKEFNGRDAYLTVDNTLKSRLLMTSGVPGVVAGKNGWLYYTDTLADWQDSSPLSDRQIFNIVNDLRITQRCVEENGRTFSFMIAPNKNSLYGENMPYYYPPGEPSHNARRVAELCERYGVEYIDLFGMFRSHDETLYLKNDSHWNNRGAALVTNRYLESVSMTDVCFDTDAYTLEEYPAGDLYQMLCPSGKLTEVNQTYSFDTDFSYTGRSSNVEDAVLTTSCSDAESSLLMYRDSFGNSLLPFMARRFGSAAFYRTVPYNLELHMLQSSPEHVLIEKVERSLDELQTMPPVLTAPPVSPNDAPAVASSSYIDVDESEENMMFTRISGGIDESLVSDELTAFIGMVTGEDAAPMWREAFTVTLDDGKQGFCAYIPTYELDGTSADISLILCDNGAYSTAAQISVDFPSESFIEDEFIDDTHENDAVE